MGISQLEFERIVYEVADEHNFGVEVDGTDVYLIYRSHKHPYRRLLDFNDRGEITGRCTTDGTVQLFEVKPKIFADRVYRRIQQYLND
jgi:hypothetical protein